MMIRAKRSLLSLLSALLFVGFSTSAQAEMITWTLSETQFTDGGTVAGSFDFDPTGVFGNFSLTVSGGNTTDFAPLTFTQANSLASLVGKVAGHNYFTFTLNDNSRFLGLAYDPNLTNAGGTSDIFPSTSNVADRITTPSVLNRDIVSGTVNGVPSGTSPVPEPGSLALLSFGAIGLFASRRRQK